MDRAAHLAWAKERALVYADAGDMVNTVASIASDLGKHSETANHSGRTLMTMLAVGGHLNTAHELRKFVEGFN